MQWLLDLNSCIYRTIVFWTWQLLPAFPSDSMYPFPDSSTIAITGTTSSGKTTWLYRLLRHKDEMFAVPPERILYCYGIFQSLFDEMKKRVPAITFCPGLPTESELDSLTSNGKHNLVILDDLMNRVTKNEDMELLFTRGAHHRRLTIIYLNQNMYCQGKSSRTINLNTHHMVLFRNPRDMSQISVLVRQVFPGKGNALVEAYRDCMKEPFGYLVLDLSPFTEDKYRMRTRIYPGETTVIYEII